MSEGGEPSAPATPGLLLLSYTTPRDAAWVRICGYGPKAAALEEEYQKLKNHGFKLIFTYPTKEEQDKINIVNRDMTYQERKAQSEGRHSLERFLAAFKSGTIHKEDIPSEVLDQLRKLL
jgi:superfamily I DNA and RNA helicase